MNKGQFLFLLLLSPVCCSYGQTQFEDVLIHDNEIWALTSKGSINLFSTSDGKKMTMSMGAYSKLIQQRSVESSNIIYSGTAGVVQKVCRFRCLSTAFKSSRKWLRDKLG
jgi:hypothetical protein